MNAEEYLRSLQETIGGDINTEFLNIGSSPRLSSTRRGLGILVDFVTPGEIRIDLKTKPPLTLRMRKEGSLSKFLSKAGIICDRQAGDTELDGRYLIDNLTQEDADVFFTPEVISFIRQLEPFEFLELTYRDYRCLKFINMEKFPPWMTVRALDTLLDLHEAVTG